jgi:hypothetical protein
MRLSMSVLISAALLSFNSFAQELKLDSITGSQTAFRALSEDLGSAFSYRGQTPAEPLGLLGFDIGVAATSTKLANTSKYANALEGKSTVVVPTLRAHKGLPFGIDVGVAYAAVPDSNVKYVGGELRYAILEGSTVTPALALRGSVSQLKGVDQLDFDTKGVDLSISKGFLMATPYAGIGKVWVNSDPKQGLGLTAEEFSQNKYFVGLGFNMMLVNLNIEADKTGDATSYSAKLGIRF